MSTVMWVGWLECHERLHGSGLEGRREYMFNCGTKGNTCCVIKKMK